MSKWQFDLQGKSEALALSWKWQFSIEAFLLPEPETDNFLWKAPCFMAILENKGRRIPLKHSIPLKPRFQRRSLRILSHIASIPLMVPGLLGIAAVFLHAADADLHVLRKQLQAAEDASDKSAIVELSRRIVEADPN